MEEMPDINQLPDSDQENPLFPINDTKMPADDHILSKNQKREMTFLRYSRVVDGSSKF